MADPPAQAGSSRDAGRSNDARRSNDAGPGAARRPFGSIYRHGFARVAVAMPATRVGDPKTNLAGTLDLARQAGERRAVLALFPELGLSSYSLEDLHQQDALLDAAEAALGPALAAEDFAAAMTALAGLRAPIDAFFETTTVNAEAPMLRRNRLCLLHRIRTVMNRVAVFSAVEGG
jgi:hypothetical protein